MKSKSMKSRDGSRKLASGHGRTKQKSGGEPQQGAEGRGPRSEPGDAQHK
jgi:hypothetical protein